MASCLLSTSEVSGKNTRSICTIMQLHNQNEDGPLCSQYPLSSCCCYTASQALRCSCLSSLQEHLSGHGCIET